MVKFITHEVTVEMTSEDFIDVVDIAGYGIGYWVKSAIVDDEECTYALTYENPDDDGYLERTLTKNDLEIAWAKIISGKVAVAPHLRQYFMTDDMGDIDALCGDVLIQVALFDKIVYG